MQLRHTFLTALSAFALFSSYAMGVINMTATQIGADVIITYSGSANLEGLSWGFEGNYNSEVLPALGGIVIGSGNGNPYSGVTTTSFGSSYTNVFASSTSSPPVGIVLGEFGTNYLITPLEYSSGMQLTPGSSTFADTTLAGLGIGSGPTYTWTWGSEANGTNDSLVLTINPIPEPSTWAALVGILCLGLAVWKRKRKA